jgi:hypothetical protein
VQYLASNLGVKNDYRLVILHRYVGVGHVQQRTIRPALSVILGTTAQDTTTS